jgi:MarR family transcriptional regulator, negative regulator of the multidrug operon emrRAB
MPVSEDRAFTVNILGTLAQTIVDRQSIGMEAVAGFGGNAPAALVTLRFYPERPISFLAHKLRISHPGAVQLVDRLAAGGLAERAPAIDGRSRHVVLTEEGQRIADAVLAQRRRVLERALSALDDQACHALAATLSTMLEALTDDLLTSEFMCRMCDELACPDDRCPVERAEPAPTDRRGTGYGVR